MAQKFQEYTSSIVSSYLWRIKPRKHYTYKALYFYKLRSFFYIHIQIKKNNTNNTLIFSFPKLLHITDLSLGDILPDFKK